MTRIARLPAVAVVVILALSAGAGRDDVEFAFKEGSRSDPHITIEVRGPKLDDAFLEALAGDPQRLKKVLRVETAERAAMLGTYEVDVNKKTIRFRSRFAYDPDVAYRAVFQKTAQDESRVQIWTPKRVEKRAVTTIVTRVSPSADVLPENLLKFYLEFSAPMSRGKAYENVRLLDANGTALDLPFLELGEELWDPRGVRFTLLFDPGRIKSGLKPREELGPVLETGKTYTLVVSTGWLDANGSPLKAEFRKPFSVGSPDVTPPDPKKWAIELPLAGSNHPLLARFPEPLDRALLGRVLGVVDHEKAAVEGTVKVGDDETSWSFVPEKPWKAGRYELLVDKTLEDRAGNRVGRPFEVDVFKKIDPQNQVAETVRLPFEVAGRK